MLRWMSHLLVAAGTFGAFSGAGVGAAACPTPGVIIHKPMTTQRMVGMNSISLQCLRQAAQCAQAPVDIKDWHIQRVAQVSPPAEKSLLSTGSRNHYRRKLI